MSKEKLTKDRIIEILEKPETKTIADVCRQLGIVRNTFYFHYYKNSQIRRLALEKQKAKLNEKIAAAV